MLFNLASCPELGRGALLGPGGESRPADRELYDAGAIYVHGHCHAEPTDDLVGITVSGISENTDTHIAPGGRNGYGLRLGLVPGRTYTVSVDVVLDARLSGRLGSSRLCIAVGARLRGAVDWSLARSVPSANDFGRRRVQVTFTVPDETDEAWVRLVAGMSRDGGSVTWERFQVTETSGPVPYFTGDTPDDRWYTYSWRDAANKSPSIRTMRAPAESFGEVVGRLTVDPRAREMLSREVFGEIRERGKSGLFAEIDRLVEFLESCLGDFEGTTGVARALGAEARGNAKEARRLLSSRAVVECDNPVVIAERARRAFSQHNWSEARDLYAKASTLAPDLNEYAYMHAASLEKIGAGTESRRIVRERVALDKDLHFDGVVAVEQDHKVFAARLEVARFVETFLPEIRQRALHFRSSGMFASGELPVFSFWAQGYDEAPAVVQMCRRELERNVAPDRLRLLENDDLAYYAEIPELVRLNIGSRRAMFADALRLDLLARYGGMWVDATCYTVEGFEEAATSLVDGDFFAFSYGGARISNWFLVARPGAYIVRMMRSALFLWWEMRDDTPDYFLFHHLFEMLYWFDGDFAAAWGRSPTLDARIPHELQRAMFSSVSRERLEDLRARSFVHKLKYQYAVSEVAVDSAVALLVRRSAGRSSA